MQGTCDPVSLPSLYYHVYVRFSAVFFILCHFFTAVPAVTWRGSTVTPSHSECSAGKLVDKEQFCTFRYWSVCIYILQINLYKKNVRFSPPPWLFLILLHFSHDRTKQSSPSFSSTTFKTTLIMIYFLKCPLFITIWSYTPEFSNEWSMKEKWIWNSMNGNFS
jgi:hypothetical protein